MKPGTPARVRRHLPRARWVHGLAALGIVLLLVSGHALAEVLPVVVQRWLGGHAWVSSGHDLLGLAFALAAAGALLACHRRAAALLRELCRVGRGDGAWLWRFVRDPLGRKAPAPWHGGRFDPLQRWVLAAMLALLLIATVSGVALYFMPPGWRWPFVIGIRAHILANEAFTILLLVHVLAGSGLLPTHRGIARSMFGDGTVPLATARRLWPGWTARQAGLPGEGGRGGVGG